MGRFARVLADFEGGWQLSREIVQSDGGRARFAGEAMWRPDPEGLRYEERGLLQIPGQPAMQAERRYLWRDDLTVWFDDGRFFHQVPPEGGETGHWCDPDQYDVAYEFGRWPEFTVRWQVRGPRKDYEMRSLYRRA